MKKYQVFSLWIGFLFWLISTATIRFFGQYFFIVKPLVFLISLYIGVFILLYIIAQIIYQIFKLNYFERVHSAVLMVISGMLLDAGVLALYSYIFPNLDRETGIALGGWLLIAYAAILCSALFSIDKSIDMKRSFPKT